MLSFGKRPRELSWYHAGPMLFGDWGTSRLYVLGIAFAATTYGSVFYVALMGALLLVVAWAYTIICRVYPEGGGVYAAARERSPLLGVIGGLLLFADYTVTAALSSLEAFHYLGFPAPGIWAMVAISLLGLVHFFGPKKAGILALWIAAAAFVGYVVLAAFSMTHVGEALERAVIPEDTFGGHWRQLVHIVLALSGIEAVANMTGIMVPPIGRTSRLTIWPVAIEVVILNLVLALGVLALPVPASELVHHEEDMLRVVAHHYVGPAFASVVSVVFALLLLSAASTAITGMLGIEFAMARDGELPRGLGRINRYGVPQWALLLAVAAPILVLLLQQDLLALAALYAIGVVGAIALNTFATATSSRLDVPRASRIGLLAVAAVMVAIWLTVAYEKSHALIFAGTVLAVGLAARYAFRQYRERVAPVERVPFPGDAPRILVATRGDPWIVDVGLDRAAEMNAAVVVALIREAAFLLDRPGDATPDPALDPEATALFEYARRRAQERAIPIRPLYAISTSPMWVLADHAVTLGVAEVHAGGSRRGRVEKVLRGSPLEELRSLLPEEVQLIVHQAPEYRSKAEKAREAEG
jgi:amino acid transporter